MTNACDGSDWTPEPGEDVIVRLDPAAHGCDRSPPRDRRSAECNKRSVLRCARQCHARVTRSSRNLARINTRGREKCNTGVFEIVRA